MFLTKKKTNNNVFLRELALFPRERGRIKENVLKHTHTEWVRRGRDRDDISRFR